MILDDYGGDIGHLTTLHHLQQSHRSSYSHQCIWIWNKPNLTHLSVHALSTVLVIYGQTSAKRYPEAFAFAFLNAVGSVYMALQKLLGQEVEVEYVLLSGLRDEESSLLGLR